MLSAEAPPFHGRGNGEGSATTPYQELRVDEGGVGVLTLIFGKSCEIPHFMLIEDCDSVGTATELE